MVRSAAIRNVSAGSGTRVKQTFSTILCIVLLGQMQTAVVAGQEPVPEPQRVKLVTPPSAPPSSAQAAEAGVQDPLLPAAPVPQLSMAAQQAQPVQQAQPSQQNSEPQQPVGTAAAPYEKPVGVPGSRPAGAAIAPAKQRRVRAVVVKVSLLLAGAAAVGAVVGLSKASHSKP